MARPSMANLIARVRTLIADPAGASQTFADDDIQNALDSHRTERRWVPLRPSATFAPGITVTFTNFYSDAQNWEDDIVLQDTGYNAIVPSVSEPLVGHWQFAAQPAGIAVRATGKTYDLYAAAADLLEAWGAQVKLDFRYVDNRAQYWRDQKFQALAQLAEKYRRLALPVSGRLVQSDAAPDIDGSGVTYPAVNGEGYGYGF